jgi:hypothetical protein
MAVRVGPFVYALGVVGASLCVAHAAAQQLAFPEAEGFGRFATGARQNLASASVYHVTNLNDAGPGSFRDAVSQSNRFVVFDVGGIVNLQSVVTFAPNITIAGQTAPGGFAVYGNRVAFHGANNIISRYWAARLGTSQGREDAASIVRGQNMIYDHMSITWGVDGTFDINPDTGQVIDNITIQNTIIGQGLDVVGHSTGGLMQVGEGNRISIIKSLFADNVTRNPKMRGENEFINNVVYGYETAGYIMGDTVNMTSNANVIGNYFIEGPVDGSSPFASGTPQFRIHAADNWVDGNRNGVLDGAQHELPRCDRRRPAARVPDDRADDGPAGGAVRDRQRRRLHHTRRRRHTTGGGGRLLRHTRRRHRTRVGPLPQLRHGSEVPQSPRPPC